MGERVYVCVAYIYMIHILYKYICMLRYYMIFINENSLQLEQQFSSNIEPTDGRTNKQQMATMVTIHTVFIVTCSG